LKSLKDDFKEIRQKGQACEDNCHGMRIDPQESRSHEEWFYSELVNE